MRAAREGPAQECAGPSRAGPAVAAGAVSPRAVPGPLRPEASAARPFQEFGAPRLRARWSHSHLRPRTYR